MITQLPRGSRLAQALGGQPTWSDEVAAIHLEGALIRQSVVDLTSSMVGQRLKPVRPVEPPEPGWQHAAAERQERERAKYEKFLQHNK